MKQDFFIAKEEDKRRLYDALSEFELPFKVAIRKGRRRSIEQNAYLWGVCYETILTGLNLKEQGWENEDIHDFMLGEYHGWEVLEGMGRKRVKPVERSSGKTKTEFADYLDFVIRKAAEMGVVIPDAEYG